MTRTFWLCVLSAVSVGIIAADLVTPPYIQFPILFVIPVIIGAWHLNRRFGIVLALVLVGCRFGIAIIVEKGVTPLWAAVVNAGIRMAVLSGLAVLTAEAHEKIALKKRVRILEGILPICMFCKRIRKPDGAWERIDTYITNHSAAWFTHTFCEACGREHYAEYLSTLDSKDAELGPAPDRGGR